MSTQYSKLSSRSSGVQFERARSAGGWLPWAASFIAIAGWAGAGAYAAATVGLDALLKQPPLMMAAEGLLGFVPGAVIIVAGFMARESVRTRETNAIVLTAARQLLAPVDSARSDIGSIAEAVAHETQSLFTAVDEARTRMTALKSDLESSVVATLKAAGVVRADSDLLMQRMSTERQNLSELSEAMRVHTEALSAAIPRHAQMLQEAANTAQDAVKKSDENMDQRIRAMEDAAKRLGERLMQLDTMGAESRKRATTLVSALTRMDEQMLQSTRMVDNAIKAGEIARAASKGTADSLRDAMSDALDAALKVSETIAARSAEASEQAREAMARLKEMAQQAEASSRSATLSASGHADATERRIAQLTEFLNSAAVRAGETEHMIKEAHERIQRVRTEAGAGSSAATPPAQPPRANGHDQSRAKPTASADFETAMREAGAPREVLDAHRNGAGAANGTVLPPLGHNQPIIADKAGEGAGDGGLSWRDLLASIEDTPAELEQTAASAVVDRLGRAGVRLAEAVKASDLRRIATAAHLGERQRRRAIRDAAPGEIQRVAHLLDQDSDLHAAARNFLAVEEPAALKALAGADRAWENADPRLSAYLLIDAALGASA